MVFSLTGNDAIRLAQTHTADLNGTRRASAEWVDLMNVAVRDLIREAPLDEVESSIALAAGAYTYTMPPDAVPEVHPGVRGQNGDRLGRIAHRDQPEERPVAEPSVFSRLGRQLFFDAKMPGARVLPFEYSRFPADVTVATLGNSLPVDPAFHDFVPERMAELAFDADDDARRAAKHAARAERVLRKARQTLAERHLSRRGRED